MKVQFMKKLVPLALITSIAVTNVGITSVAAQTPTNAITQSVEGPVAVENESVSVGDTATVTYPTQAEVNDLKDGEVDTNRELTGIDGTDGFKFYYDYGTDESTLTDDSVAVASYNIKSIAGVAKLSDFIDREDLFTLKKGGTAVDASKVSFKLTEIKATGSSTSNFQFGGLRITIVAKMSAINFGTADTWSLYCKTGASAETEILKINATGVKKQAPKYTYAENAKGEVAKYTIRETESGYALYCQTASTDAAGTVTYTPATLTGISDQAGAGNAGFVCNLTAEQIKNLPFTKAEPATRKEYEDLKVAENETINGNTLAKLEEAENKEIDKWLVGINTALKDGSTAEEAEKTQAEKDLVSLYEGIADGTPSATTYKTALKDSAKTAIVADHKKYIADSTDDTIKLTADELKKLDNAYIAAMYTALNDENSDLSKLDGTTTSIDTQWRTTFTEDANGNIVTPDGYPNPAQNIPVLRYYANKLSETDFATWMDSTEGEMTDTPFELAMKTSKIATEVYKLDISEDTDVAAIIDKYAAKALFSDIVVSDGALTSATKCKASSYIKTKTEEIDKVLLANDFAHKSVLDTASIKWITETVNAKGALASGAGFAKFAVTKNDKTSFAAKATGDSVIVGATKANKQTNSYVIVKAVSKNYKAATAKTAQKGDVYAQAEFYVTPVVSTGFTERSLSTTAEKPGIKFDVPTATDKTAAAKTYNLELAEGKSFKLPFALKDGADKTLVYDFTGNGFTVVNGTVKAIAGGCTGGEITVYPAALGNNFVAETDATTGKKLDEATAIKINVTTTATVKQIKANSNNVTMYPGATQYISFGTNPASFGTYTYEITGVEGYKSATFVNAIGAASPDATPTNNTVLKLEAYSASEIAADETKQPAKTVKATVKIKKGTDEVDVKDFTLNVKWAGAGANAKTVKETYKKVNSDGVVEINVPVGGVVNLGASVNPATADRSIKYLTAKDAEVTLDDTTTKVTVSAIDALNNANDATWSGLALANGTGADTDTADNAKLKYAETGTAVSGGITMNGDVVKAVTAGTYYVKGWTAAKNEKGENLTTNIYKINVYTPGASIIMNDLRDDAKGFTYTDTVAHEIETKDSVYTIVGGNLMTKAAAATDGNKTIMGGQTITIAEPYTLGTKEEIEWKCNKPSAIRITKGENYKVCTDNTTTGSEVYGTTEYPTLKLDLMQAGTFTITGTTKYTKQKFVFKVNVGADATAKRPAEDSRTCEKMNLDKTDGTSADVLTGADGDVKMKVKDTANVAFFTGTSGLAGTVKLESTDKKVLSVAANGTVKAVAKGSAAIKATFTSADKKTSFTVTSKKITVEPQVATISKFTIPSGVSIGKDFNVSAAIKDAKIADCNVTWEYGKITSGELASSFDVTDPKDSNNAAITMSAWSLGNKPSGKVKLADDGTYLVRLKVAPKTDATADNTVYEYGIVEAFEKTPTIVNVNNNDADAKKAIAALAAAPKAGEEEGTTVGGAGYGVYIIPVFATDKDGAVVDAADIEWTSSNVSLATATAITDTDLANAKANMKSYLTTANTTDAATNHFDAAVEEENAIVKSAADAYGLVKIVTASANSGLTGKVTLTGVLKNSGKKVTVTLNIKNEAKKVVDKYNPIEVTKNNDSAELNASNGFQNIVALKGDEYDKNAVNKLKKGATYTYYAYALVDTTDAKLLKAKPADHIKAINTPGAQTQDKLTYTSTDGKYSVSKILAAATTDATAGNTYYLAQVAVSVKVKTAAVMNEAGDAVTTDAVLETTPTKQVITIASQTPVIIKSTT